MSEKANNSKEGRGGGAGNRGAQQEGRAENKQRGRLWGRRNMMNRKRKKGKKGEEAEKERKEEPSIALSP